MRHFMFKIFGVAAVATALAAQSANLRAADDIIDTAVGAGSFKTLAAALTAADLVDALKGEGPFTVFAPTDEAFAKLPEGTIATLLKPENKAKLAGILTYHVVAGAVTSGDVVKLAGATTLNGQRVDIKYADKKVMVDKATVVKADIKCSNGVIHVIDSVMLPADANIPATADKAGTFKTLLAAVKAAGLVDVLSGDGPFTVFAPTDEAFAKLPKGTVESLLKPENKDKLVAILKYHVVSGRVFSDDAVKAEKAETLQGQDVRIAVKDGKAMVNESRLVATDIDASNGVIHVVDAVLLPKDKKVGAAEGRQMIEHAVAGGSRLFNSGHHAECAEVYMSTIREMVAYGDGLPESVVTHLSSTLDQAEQTQCATQRSWTLRRGLDRARYAMRSSR